MPAGAYVNSCARAAGAGHLLVYFLVPYIGAWVIGASQPVQVGAFLSCVITFTLFEAAYYCAIMRRRHPVDSPRPVRPARRWPQLLQTMAISCCRSVPQHDAGAAHANIILSRTLRSCT